MELEENRHAELAERHKGDVEDKKVETDSHAVPERAIASLNGNVGENVGVRTLRFIVNLYG